MGASTRSVTGRFWLKVDRRGPAECWPWRASRTPQGYGQFRLDGRNQRAHRVAYVLAVGPIPEGMCVLHSCDNPPCCNPAHLWIGTQADNTADRDAKGHTQRHGRGGTRGIANPRSKLNIEEARLIRARHKRGESLRSLGRRFGVDHKTVRNVVIGRTWREDS